MSRRDIVRRVVGHERIYELRWGGAGNGIDPAAIEPRSVLGNGAVADREGTVPHLQNASAERKRAVSFDDAVGNRAAIRRERTAPTQPGFVAIEHAIVNRHQAGADGATRAVNRLVPRERTVGNCECARSDGAATKPS